MNFWNQFPDKKLLLQQPALDENTMLNVNAHIHTPYSYSAFDTIDHALKLARNEDVKILGINDFYTTKGYQEWAGKCAAKKIFPLFNIEFIGLSPAEQESSTKINDPKNPGRIYISGKGLSYPQKLNKTYQDMLQNLYEQSNFQSEAMVKAMNRHLERLNFDFRLSYNDIRENQTMGLVRERHLAGALRKAVYEKTNDQEKRNKLLSRIVDETLDNPGSDADVENLIRNKLLKAGGAAFIPESPEMFIELKTINELIIASGGIPTYPLLADSVNGGFTDFEQDKDLLLKWLQDNNICSVEFITNRNSTKALEEYAGFFTENNIIVTFGSEHNTPELIPMSLKDKHGNDLSDTLKKINLDGATLLAAHQYAVAKEEKGLLDDTGNLRTDGLDEMRQIGTRVLNYYFSNNYN